MDLLQNTLNDALAENAAETERWTKYHDEQVQAEQSMREFQKKLEVDIMVPIGSKALMPGRLYHTGEVLVGHGNRLFSKTTTLQAIRICKHRQQYAEERLKRLQEERDLHKNKLELPFVENAFGSGQQEIIEEYDEEREKKWREEHRRRMAEHNKKREAVERQKAPETVEKSDEDVFSMLEELELMEEFSNELDQLGIETDEQLKKLLSGEIQLPPEKKRVAHKPMDNIVVGNKTGKIDVDELNEVETRLESLKVTSNKPKKVDLMADPTAEKSAALNIAENTSSSVKEAKLEETKVQPVKRSNEASGKLPVESNNKIKASNNSKQPIISSSVSPSASDSEESYVNDHIRRDIVQIMESSKKMKRPEKEVYLKRRLKGIIEMQQTINKTIDHPTLIRKLDLEELRDFIEDELLKLDANLEPMSHSDGDDDQFVPAKMSSKISFSDADSVMLIDKDEAPCKASDLQSSDFGLTLELKFRHSDIEFVPPARDEGEIASPVDIYEMFKVNEANTARKSILKNKEKVLEETHHKTVPEVGKKKQKKVVQPEVLGDVVERKVTYGVTEKPTEVVGNGLPEQVSKFKAKRKNKS